MSADIGPHYDVWLQPTSVSIGQTVTAVSVSAVAIYASSSIPSISAVRCKTSQAAAAAIRRPRALSILYWAAR